MDPLGHLAQADTDTLRAQDSGLEARLCWYGCLVLNREWGSFKGYYKGYTRGV